MSSLGHRKTVLERTLFSAERIFGDELIATITSIFEAGFIQIVFIIVSILIIRHYFASALKEMRQERQDPFRRPPNRSIIIEAISQIAYAGIVVISFTDSILNQNGSNWVITLLPTCMPTYIFLLGILRLTIPDGPLRSLFLHNVNWLLTGMLVVSWTTTLAPLAVTGGTFNSTNLELWKTGFITASTTLAFVTRRTWCPPSTNHPLYYQLPSNEVSAEETCSYFSYYFSYGWLTNIVLTGCRGKLSFDELLQIPWFDEPIVWLDRLLKGRKTASNTLWLLLDILRGDIKHMVFFSLVSAVAEFVGPFAGLRLLQDFENPSSEVFRPWVWVLLLFVGPMTKSLASHQYMFASTRLIVHLKMSLIQEIYHKLLRRSSFETQIPDDKSADALPAEELPLLSPIAKNINVVKKPFLIEVMNLISHDIDALAASRDLVIILAAVPVSICMSVIFLYDLLGWSTLIGLAILTSSFPLTTILTRKLVKVQKELMSTTDGRIATVSEYLSSIRAVKYLAWEHVVSERIREARVAEQRCRLQRHIYSIVILVLGDFIPLFALFGMLLVSAVATDRKLTAASAFTSVMITEILRQQFIWVSNAGRFIGQSLTALERIDTYLETAEECQHHPIGPPMISHANIRRTPSAQLCLRDLSITFEEGKLNIILGPSGCGKSTILLSLLGQTILENGLISCPKKVAYASQSPFLLNDTIRNNIIFYNTYEEIRYDAVVDACALQKDLTELEFGDMTRVGENGSALSEGQKQRIALARAIYSKCSLVLLDDVFSSLDVETCVQVWKRCFKGGLLRDRTVILTTQLDWLSKHAALLIHMDNGQITDKFYPPNIEDALTGDFSYAKRLSERVKRRRPLVNARTLRASPIAPQALIPEVHLITEETAGMTHDHRMLIFHYLHLFGGKICAMSMATAFLAQAMLIFIHFSISLWVNGDTDPGKSFSGFYIFVYAISLLFFLVFSTMSKVSFHLGGWKAASTIHEHLTTSILSASTRWFDINPVGRVINRFSKDMASMDSLIVENLRGTMDNIFWLALRIGSISSIMPIFAAPAIILCAFGLTCGEVYTRTQISVRSLASASRSPILSHFRDTMRGRIVITSRGMQDDFASLLSAQIRDMARAEETQYNLNQWVGVRADAAAALVSLIAGIIAIHKSTSLSSGLLGFSLTNVIGLSSNILGLVRKANELEAELNSFQRLREYAHLDSEQLAHNSSAEPVGPPEELPDDPVIEFRDFSARYADNGPTVIKNISFKVMVGERIGIVGRTGEGKSTIALSLLGSVPITSGEIFINGTNIHDLELPFLRREVTLIPQEPVLFRGSVHENIDPTGTIPTPQVARSLEVCSILETVSITPDGAEYHSPWNPLRGNESAVDMLEAEVTERGDNFSAGQRQIISLARAVARQPHIVVMDEAMASMDGVTEAAIQTVVRDEFNSATVISITHRMQAVMDYDRVMVMEGGAIKEMDTPGNLWKARGTFYQMVMESDDLGEFAERFEENFNFADYGFV